MIGGCLWWQAIRGTVYVSECDRHRYMRRVGGMCAVIAGPVFLDVTSLLPVLAARYALNVSGV